MPGCVHGAATCLICGAHHARWVPLHGEHVNVPGALLPGSGNVRYTGAHDLKHPGETMNAQARLGQMLRQSMDVLLHPAISTFRRYAVRASDSDALTYVAVAAFIVTLLGVAGSGGGMGVIGLLLAIINTLFGFYLFAGVMYFIAKQFGGSGEFITVVYLFALFYAPILILTWLLLVAARFVPGAAVVSLPLYFLGFALQAFYAYQAIQAGMYLRRRRDALIAVLVGLVVLWVIERILSGAAFI